MLKTALIWLVCFYTCCGSPLHPASDNSLPMKNSWLTQFEDPEANMTMREAVNYHGYPFEEYTIHSKDGYHTIIHRIPHGKKNSDMRSRQPVFIMHGITGMSSVFIANIPEKNMAYVLADEGYDVWLGNLRGNDFSRKHDKFNTSQKEFWTFGWQESAYYDVPVMIDLILKTSGQKQVHYIGHSMGTTIAFAMLSMLPEYNQKVKGLFALAPVVYLHNVTGILATLSKNPKIVEAVANSLKLYEFRHDSPILDRFLPKRSCDLPSHILCNLSLDGGDSYDNLRLNVTRAPVFEHFGISSTPFRAILHYGQLINSKKFQYYDLGPTANQEKYGQPTPPDFALSNVTVPVALLHSSYDSMSTSEDVKLLRQQISGPVILDYLVPDPKFLHLEFLWSFNIEKYVIEPVLKAMKQLD